jgi:hypothetical protein
MSNRFTKLLALTGVSAALAIGGAGVAQASQAQVQGHGRDHVSRHDQRSGNSLDKKGNSRDKKGNSRDKKGNSRDKNRR